MANFIEFLLIIGGIAYWVELFIIIIKILRGKSE